MKSRAKSWFCGSSQTVVRIHEAKDTYADVPTAGYFPYRELEATVEQREDRFLRLWAACAVEWLVRLSVRVLLDRWAGQYACRAF